jgi:hypothetical protein
MSNLPEPIARGDLCGRRAGEKFRAAVEQGKPLSSVVAVRPKDMRFARAEAYEMIGSPDEAIRNSGLFWRSYWDGLQSVFPDIERFA